MIYLKSIFRNGPNLLSLVSETKIQKPTYLQQKTYAEGKRNAYTVTAKQKKGKDAGYLHFAILKP
jgi:hypothetical protein